MLIPSDETIVKQDKQDKTERFFYNGISSWMITNVRIVETGILIFGFLTCLQPLRREGRARMDLYQRDLQSIYFNVTDFGYNSEGSKVNEST